jgi:hypothetical protein
MRMLYFTQVKLRYGAKQSVVTSEQPEIWARAPRLEDISNGNMTA